MCFNYKVSLVTFLLGTIFSVILIKNGNKQYLLENKISGIFLIFISLIQFMEFIFWIDIKNQYGLNKLATIIGPLLNAGQPTILYLIKYIIFRPNLFTFDNFNLPVVIMNIAYFVYLISNYIIFLSGNNLITSEVSKENHLIWPWLKHYNPYLYCILFVINIFYLFNVKYSVILSGLIFFFLYLSNKYFKYNVGELWCFFGSFTPLLMVFLSYYIDILVPFTF